jgi:hypothetical protein
MSKYRLIGDDLIISDPGIANHYKEMCKALGLDINPGKTVESIPGQFNCAEVAKQLYLNGKCLTPITPGIVKDLKKPYMFNTCIGLFKDRYDFKPELYPMLIDTFFRKERDKKLVWVLCTDPMSGNIMPGEPGYDINSPWIHINCDNYENRYLGIYFQRLQSKSEDLYADLVEYLKFGEGPLGDLAHSRKPTYAMRKVLLDVRKRMDKLSQQDEYLFDLDDLRRLANEFAYIPDPRLPFMERKELRSKRLSSIVKYVYDTMV